MKFLILGASGATGKQLVEQLSKEKIPAKLVVRNKTTLPLEVLENKNFEILEGSIQGFSAEENDEILAGCDVVVSCLGHNLSFKGMFGKPRLLVTDSIRNISLAINRRSKKTKIILMNTTGVENLQIVEKRKWLEKIVLTLLYLLLPPQKDNVKAAKYLALKMGEQQANLEWSIVRPDALINEEKESKYEIVETIQRSPLFDPGKTSRINVAHFMLKLAIDEKLWDEWKYKMPVIYNQ